MVKEIAFQNKYELIDLIHMYDTSKDNNEIEIYAQME